MMKALVGAVVLLIMTAIFSGCGAKATSNRGATPRVVVAPIQRPVAKVAPTAVRSEVPKPVIQRTEPPLLTTTERPSAEDLQSEQAESLAVSKIGDPELIETGGLKIADIVFARGVKIEDEKKVPVDPGKSFSVKEKRIYAFLRVDNPSEEETEITVSWAPPEGGRERGKVAVTIAAQSTWNTRAFNRHLNIPGIWHVVVRSKDNKVIARAPFELTE